MSDATKPKFHCPMDRIARENTQVNIPERFFVDAFEATMAWQERAFERDANDLPESIRAKLFLHVVEHAQTKIAEQLSVAFRHSASIFGVSEDAIDRAVAMDRISDMLRGLGAIAVDMGDDFPRTTDKSKMEA